MAEQTKLREIMTGRPRPRHLRFAAALSGLVPETILERRDRNVLQRLQVNAVCSLTGIRTVALPQKNIPVVLHQALASTDVPYVAEFDVPLGVHGYSYAAYLRHAGKARRLLEQPALRSIFVFSEWAKRSFALHFGEAVAAKCRVSYPLAAPSVQPDTTRRYDFAFVSTQFRIKGGPELVRAFTAVRESGAPDACICVVTNLEEARLLLGDLAQFPGIEWREAKQSAAAIADLLVQSHCLVHPSLWDSFGVVVLEALAAGCAVIATSMASFPELVAEGSGILLEPPVKLTVGDFTIPWFDPKALAAALKRMTLARFETDLAEAMTRLATDHTHRDACQFAARDLYARRFSSEAWSRRMKADLVAAFGESIVA